MYAPLRAKFVLLPAHLHKFDTTPLLPIFLKATVVSYIMLECVLTGVGWTICLHP